jgi:hypothetical protein
VKVLLGGIVERLDNQNEDDSTKSSDREYEQKRPWISRGSPLSIKEGLLSSQTNDLLSAEDWERELTPEDPELELSVEESEEELRAEDLEEELQADHARFLDTEHTEKEQVVQKGEDDYKPTTIQAQETLHTDQSPKKTPSETILPANIKTAEGHPTPEQGDLEPGAEKEEHDSENDLFPSEPAPPYTDTEATAAAREKSKDSSLRVDDGIPQVALPSRSLIWTAVQLVRSLIRPRVPEGYKRITWTCVSH